MRISEAFAAARALEVARLDVQLLLAHLLGRPRTWLLAHDDHGLSAPQADALRCLLRRRADGEPLAYLVGGQAFGGLQLRLTPAVLIPRPETELLVEWALEKLVGAPERSVVDLGTGSGAIALALKKAQPTSEVSATDISGEALQVARENASRHGLAVHFSAGDWWAALPGRRFGLAVSNPPYVAGNDPHLTALRHEPRAALTPEGDGLAALRHVVEGAPPHLLPGAWLLLEHGHDQAAEVESLLRARGFSAAETRFDLAGLARCTGAPWTGAK